MGTLEGDGVYWQEERKGVELMKRPMLGQIVNIILVGSSVEVRGGVRGGGMLQGEGSVCFDSAI